MTFFEFSGRGTRNIGRDKIFRLEPDPGAVFLITTRIGNVDFIVAWCRSAIVERWGCYSIGAFTRVADANLNRFWAQPMDSELMIYHAVSVHLVPLESWMSSPSLTPLNTLKWLTPSPATFDCNAVETTTAF
ncbi:MAG: hypothetical protein H7A48_03920 [Akkermansiaceae bacterium]|nr:hypothetical protein [Akkermansiaceae bacterium]